MPASKRQPRVDTTTLTAESIGVSDRAAWGRSPLTAGRKRVIETGERAIVDSVCVFAALD
jgi:hypothetical protein